MNEEVKNELDFIRSSLNYDQKLNEDLLKAHLVFTKKQVEIGDNILKDLVKRLEKIEDFLGRENK
jgi:hypothetical protein